jgi:hypothetical protein
LKENREEQIEELERAKRILEAIDKSTAKSGRNAKDNDRDKKWERN